MRLISPKRGEIHGCNGITLARNEQSFRITLVEEEADDVKGVWDKLGELITITPKMLNRLSLS